VIGSAAKRSEKGASLFTFSPMASISKVGIASNREWDRGDCAANKNGGDWIKATATVTRCGLN
jgi:hypothetical protein